MSLSDEQIANIFQSLLNADQRLKAIEAELVVARRNEQHILKGLKNFEAAINDIDQCLIDNDMATRNPESVAKATEPEIPNHLTLVHPLTPKEPA